MGLAIAAAVAYFVVALTAVLSLCKAPVEADSHLELYDRENEDA